MRRREAIQGYLLLSPWLLGFVLFSLGPMVASLILSLTEYSLMRSPRFIGVQNYVKALTDDDLFWKSLGRTLYFAGVTVPVATIGAILLAALLNKGLLGTSVYRTFFFLPHLTPIVASALLWRWILQPDFGPVNLAIWKVLGVEGPKWLGSPDWALPGLILMSLWMTMGGNRMIIFLAGMQGVPEELYEVAEIDGAFAARGRVCAQSTLSTRRTRMAGSYSLISSRIRTS
jgi:multiple sugar transport system permease protein